MLIAHRATARFGVPADDAPTRRVALPPLFPPAVEVVAMRFDERLAEAPVPASLSSAVPKRRAEFVAGRLCARAALAALGAPVAEIPIGAMRAPVWPDGFVGSITHTQRLAAAAVARASDLRSLGLDIERIVSEERARRMAPLVAREPELRQVGASDAARAFTAAFAAKEAVFKCLAPVVGCYFDFLDAQVVDGDEGALTVRLLRDLGELSAGFELTARFAFFDGFVAAAVVLDPPLPARS